MVRSSIAPKRSEIYLAESHSIIVVHKSNTTSAHPGPSPPTKLLVAFGPLGLGVAGEHALEAHAYGFDVLDGAPALGAEQVKAYYAVGVYVRMEGYLAGRILFDHEVGFGWF